MFEMRKEKLKAFVGLRNRVQILTIPYDICTVPRVQRKDSLPECTANGVRLRCAEMRDDSGSIKPNQALIPR